LKPVPEPYVYDRCEVVNVHDGDTCTVNIDLGFSIIFRGQIIRLARINAPELATPEGPPSQVALSGMITGKPIVLKTTLDRKEKFGRYLGEIWVGGLNVNDEMVRRGFAVYEHY
jgi:micrococcal nuclease